MAGPAFNQPINLAARVGVLADMSLTARGVGALQPQAGFDVVLRMVDSPPLNCQCGYLESPLEMIWRLQQIADCGWLPAQGSEPCKRTVLGSGDSRCSVFWGLVTL